MSKYMQWKGWSSSVFGQTDSMITLYYNKELNRLKKKFKLKKFTDVLEIGFGNGEFLRYCREHSLNVLGTEIDSDLLNIASKQGFEVFHWDDRSHIQPESFDLIVAFDVIEHLNRDELNSCFEFLYKISKPGAVILMRHPNGDSPFALKNQNGDLTHCSFIGSGIIRQFASMYSFSEFYFFAPCDPIGIKQIHAAIYLAARSLIRSCANALLNFLFSPRETTLYTSPNIISILIK